MKKSKINIEKKVLSLISKALEYGAIKEEKRWPPYCTTILHQPKRPVFKSNVGNEENKN